MATLATFFRRSDLMAAEHTVEAVDPYRMRSLPADNIYFFFKRIDNSRLLREADTKARPDCWRAIGTACAVAVLLGAAVSPRIGGILTGYQMQRLKAEQSELLDKRRALMVEEAQMLNPSRLDELAAAQKLAAPAPGQEMHLQPKETSFAMNVVPLPVSTR